LVIGKRAAIGRNSDIVTRKRGFPPRQLYNGVKRRSWRTPVDTPIAARMMPMTGGSNPNPPTSIGVARYTGSNVWKEISRMAKDAALPAATSTGATRSSQKDSGFS